MCFIASSIAFSSLFQRLFNGLQTLLPLSFFLFFFFILFFAFHQPAATPAYRQTPKVPIDLRDLHVSHPNPSISPSHSRPLNFSLGLCAQPRGLAPLPRSSHYLSFSVTSNVWPVISSRHHRVLIPPFFFFFFPSHSLFFGIPPPSLHFCSSSLFPLFLSIQSPPHYLLVKVCVSNTPPPPPSSLPSTVGGLSFVFYFFLRISYSVDVNQIKIFRVLHLSSTNDVYNNHTRTVYKPRVYTPANSTPGGTLGWRSGENEDIIWRDIILESFHDVKDMDKYSCPCSRPLWPKSNDTELHSLLWSLYPLIIPLRSVH